MPQSVAPLLSQQLADPYDRMLAESILGTADERAILQGLDAFARAALGVGLAEVTFCELSVGAAFGLVLTDGRRVLVKAWSPATSAAALKAEHAVQEVLATQGFPAPHVIVPPRPFMAGSAAVLEWLDHGVEEDANQPAVRRAMAIALAHLIGLATPFHSMAGLPYHAYPQGRVWGRPHNALFNFEATRRGAEWIDEIAAASATVASSGKGRLVVGHVDWSAKNMRFADGVVSAVYDWDSLLVARESVVVGMAAAFFPSSNQLSVRHIPPLTDMVAFIREYEEAAGRLFTPEEWRAAGAAATYLMAYTARCEHAGAAAASPGTATDSEPANDSAISTLRRYAVSSPANMLTGVMPSC